MVEQKVLQLSADDVHYVNDSFHINIKTTDELKVMLTEDEIDRIRSPWTFSLISKLHGKGFRYQNFISKLKVTWRVTGEMKFINLGYGFFLVNFSEEDDLVRVSKKAFWFIGDNNVLSVRKWEPNFKPSNADPFTYAPISWVRLPELPIEYYDKWVLNKIGNKIGVVLHIDSKTSACEQHGKFARMCIQFDPEKPLPKTIKIGSFEQPIQYEGIKLICPNCGMIGHRVETCPSTIVQLSSKNPSPSEDNEMPSSLLRSTSAPQDDESNVVEVVEHQPIPSNPSHPVLPLLVCKTMRKWNYEVFVSFRGEDTRKGFCAYLYRALEKAAICHYRDTDQGERGLKVKEMLLEAIQQSMNALILFSTNYADSAWCLDELVEILKCNEKYHAHGHIVIPVFYNVDPSDVRGLKGEFGRAFRKCIDKNGTQKEAEWKKALKQAGNMSGWDLKSDDEPALIDNIVKTISSRVSFDQSPYGGDRGDPYDDNIYTGIRKMTIVVVASMIESISIEYDLHGSLVRSKRYGGAQAGKTFTVRLNHPKEYLTAISGHIKGTGMDAVVQSLVIKSNERDYGAYGVEHGKPFSIHANEDEKIVGFFGKCGSQLSSIGAHCKPNYSYLQTIGPFGSSWDLNWDDGIHQDVRQVKVTFDSRIRSISIVYDNYGHSIGPFSHHCEAPGTESDTLDLEYPYEYITSLSGYTCESFGMTILQSLTIHTNEKSYGPYGTEVGNHFCSNNVNQQGVVKILGFKGRYNDNNLESIEAYVEPISDIYPYTSTGPFGGEGGNKWNDGTHANLRQIVVKWHNYIDSICFEYESNEAEVVEERHGGAHMYDHKLEAHTVNLDPDEYVTRFSGYYGRGAAGDNILRSLTFESNKRKYGPYGNEEGIYFVTQPNLGKIVGFYGSNSSEYLVSIGAYFKSSMFHNHPLKTIGPFGSDDLGDSWDDGRFIGLRQIEIRSMGIIDAIRCVYDNGERSIRFPHHGGLGGQSRMISLDYPNEYIVSMSGHIGRYDIVPILVSSITFRTNYDKTHGPFGIEDGVPFSFGSNIGKIVGFHGRSGVYLNAIGAHVDILN